ncbi:hypothetical protein KGP43_08495 [Pediococcus ethanolidurans]|nr:hypothetical protein [Pediococcus ethanolidurans]
MLEGAAEAAIIDILLENNLLVFSKDELIMSANGERYQQGLNERKFARDFLRRDFGSNKIHMHIVLDKLNFSTKLHKLSDQVGNVTCYVTREEIESIQLFARSDWNAQFIKYKDNHTGKEAKPSAFFKNNEGLGIKNIKKYDYVYNLWGNRVADLQDAIKQVKINMIQKHSLRGLGNDKKYLADLLK